MDNISRRHSDEDTTNSMYLSFDAESTMSTACYKTLEAMSDISVLSCIEMDDDSVNQNKSDDNHTNSTLEVQNFHNASPLKTVRKVGFPDVKLNTPLRVLPKNILNEYKTLCSTPSKEQLLKTVEVTRGSEATRSTDLGLAFLGVDDEKPAYFPPPYALHEENKENALPDSEEISTLSTCSSGEITTTVIERKITSISEEESVDEPKKAEKEMVSVDIVDETSDFYCSSVDNTKKLSQVKKKTELKTENLEIIPIINIEDMDIVGIIDESLEKQEEKTPLDKEIKVALEDNNLKLSSKPKIAVLTQNARRSICEPNLETNKPSRIIDSDNKRRSFLPTCKKSVLSMDAEIEIPLLMSKMLKISNTHMETKKGDTKKKEIAMKQDNPTPAGQNYIMASKKTRISLLPSAPGNKRPFGFTQRMSVVVKTTLNSPARKIARQSLMSNAISSLQKRSVIPQKITSTDNSKLKKVEMLPRKSMVQKTFGLTTPSNIKSLAPLQETSTKPTGFTQRYSICPSAKMSGKVMVNGGQSHNKPDKSYNCNVCNEKFRIKSLLDAHKRSHESDNKPPAFIKKHSTVPASGTVLGNFNQCKYCDKKFALLKALHIHLLQNCSKIPPSEKRKLQYTDLNHVEKAQLPKIFSHHSLQSSASSSISSVNNAPQNTTIQTNSTSNKSSSESLNKKKDAQKITTDLVTTTDGSNITALQTAAQKVRNISAHAGVYRTPSKAVPCHLCKLTFKSILDYTNHNLTTHGSYKPSEADDTDKAVENKIPINHAYVY